jgi:hypothetical protein
VKKIRKLKFLPISFFMLIEIFTSIAVSADYCHNTYDRPLPGCNLVYFSQGDPAWRGINVGGVPFGPNGCKPTSFATVFSSFGNIMSPLEWTQILYDSGYFDEGTKNKSEEEAIADGTPTSSVVYAASLMGLKALHFGHRMN